MERLRIRSDRKPVYNLDDSDDDDFLPKKDRTLEQVEAIVRTDAVCLSSLSLFVQLLILSNLYFFGCYYECTERKCLPSLWGKCKSYKL